MNDQLMTEATQTNSAEASQPVDQGATSEETSYGGDLINAPGEQVSAEQSQEAQGEATSGEESATEENTSNAPEAYEFAESEEYTVDDKVIDAFKEAARDLDLSNDAAQKMVDKMAPQIAQRQQEQLQAVQQEWLNASTNDKEFGGENLQENLSIARKAMDQLGTPELGEFLQKSGLGNHPELVRMMYRAGKAISADTYVGPSHGSGAAKNQPRDMAGYSSALYPNQQSN